MDSTAVSHALRACLEPHLERDPGGRSWLPDLLRAASHSERLGATREDPGYLHLNLTVPGLENRRPCFQYPVAPPPALLEWFIDHPQELTWPEQVTLSPEATMLRRALIFDEPPGACARAQDRARELMPVRSAFAREWWRFEETYEPDCLLMSDTLVLVLLAVDDAGEIEPVSPWFPQRSRLVQALETAERLARDRAAGAIVCCRATPQRISDETVRAAVQRGAPHLDQDSRTALCERFLGTLELSEHQP